MRRPGLAIFVLAGGLLVRLANHPTPQKHLPETVAGGLAIFDYDGDGPPDLFFTNGAAIPALEKDSPEDWNRLFHNEGELRFTDVTERAGVRGRGYSMGAAAGDYDNDGWKDLFSANAHVNDEIESFEAARYRLSNAVFANRGDGTFADASDASGVGTRTPGAHRGLAVRPRPSRARRRRGRVAERTPPAGPRRVRQPGPAADGAGAVAVRSARFLQSSTAASRPLLREAARKDRCARPLPARRGSSFSEQS